jgi:hypothetical protein
VESNPLPLRRAKAGWHILARPSVSGDYDVLQVFCRTTGGALSAVYLPVSARLQHTPGFSARAGDEAARPDCPAGATDEITLRTMPLAHPVRKYGPKTVLPHDAKSLTGSKDRSRGQRKEKNQWMMSCWRISSARY